MTFLEAVELAKQGKGIRTPDMGDGWCFIWVGAAGAREAGLWARNPVTGSLLGFTPDETANNWHEVTL